MNETGKEVGYDKPISAQRSLDEAWQRAADKRGIEYANDIFPGGKAVTALEGGEKVIHMNDIAYYEACEKALRVCVKQLNAFENDFNGARVGNDSEFTLNMVNKIMVEADPLAGTEGESFINSLHYSG